MALLSETIKAQVKDMFNDLRNEVKIITFTQEIECYACKDNRMLMEEISTLSEKIKLEIYDFVNDKQQTEKYKIDKIPATVIAGEKDFGIRFYGIPAGYEFMSLIHAIKLVSSGISTLPEFLKEKIKNLIKPVHIQVFVTLTCPYCPAAVQEAHKIALESDMVKADMIVANDFPYLANKYNVSAVPKIVINETHYIEGAIPADAFVNEVVKSAEELV